MGTADVYARILSLGCFCANGRDLALPRGWRTVRKRSCAPLSGVSASDTGPAARPHVPALGRRRVAIAQGGDRGRR